MQSYVFATQVFYVFRVAREVDPYDRAGYKSSKFSFTVPFFRVMLLYCRSTPIFFSISEISMEITSEIPFSCIATP